MTFTWTEERPLAAQECWAGTWGTDGWTRTPRPGDPDKQFVVSADRHAIGPGGKGPA